MNVTLVVFSQTGNTRRVAEAMADTFKEASHSVRILSLKKTLPEDVPTADLLGVGSPCFSSQAPTPVKEFLRKLPPMNGKRAFVFVTASAAPGRVLYDLSHLLQAKGAQVIGGFLARGEVRHPAPSMHGRMPHHPNADDLSHARNFATAVIDHVLAGRPGPVIGSRPDTFKPMSRFYNLVASISTDGFIRLIMPEPRLNPARCDQCKWCVDTCPMDNISLQPYPLLGNQCIRCYHCLTGCPRQAFEADWRLGDMTVAFFYNTTFLRWFGDLKPGERIY